MTVSKALQIAGILVGMTAVIVQFGLSLDRFTSDGLSVAGAIVRYFSFFTILTNLFVLAVHMAGATPAPASREANYCRRF